MKTKTYTTLRRAITIYAAIGYIGAIGLSLAIASSLATTTNSFTGRAETNTAGFLAALVILSLVGVYSVYITNELLNAFVDLVENSQAQRQFLRHLAITKERENQ